MSEFDTQAREEQVGLGDLDLKFLTLRIGEEIERLEIKEIRRVVDSNAADNLSGVDFKFIVESKDKKLLRINSWALWNKLREVLKKAGTIQSTVSMEHTGVGLYEVELRKN